MAELKAATTQCMRERGYGRKGLGAFDVAHLCHANDFELNSLNEDSKWFDIFDDFAFRDDKVIEEDYMGSGAVGSPPPYGTYVGYQYRYVVWVGKSWLSLT